MENISLSITNTKHIHATLIKSGDIAFYVESSSRNFLEFKRLSKSESFSHYRSSKRIAELNRLGFIPVYFDIKSDTESGTWLSACMVREESRDIPLSIVPAEHEMAALDTLLNSIPDIDKGVVFNDEESEYIVTITDDNLDKEWLRVKTRLAFYAMDDSAVFKMIGRIAKLDPERDEVSFTSLPNSTLLL